MNYFFQGLIFLVPILFTLWIAGSAFLAIDNWFRGRFASRSPASGSW